MTWSKVVDVSSRDGSQHSVKLSVAEEGEDKFLLLSTRRTAGERVEPYDDEPVVIGTANMAGDLAHALIEAARHIQEE